MNGLKAVFEKLKIWAKELKSNVLALYIAYKRPDVPWYAKLLAIIVVGYALSPIDLIPDFIPVLGYLDDLILLPLGILLIVKLIPADIMEECRSQAKELFNESKPKNRIAALIIILIWLLLIFLIFLKII
ncbi:MAG: YkvA family protein [Clostridiaceae bacterium]